MSRLRGKRHLRKENASIKSPKETMLSDANKTKGRRLKIYFFLASFIFLLYICRFKMFETVVATKTKIVLSKKFPDLYTYEIVQTYPHDPQAFIQGLVWYKDDIFIESTGLYGKSSLRKIDLESGKILKYENLPLSVFGEGITIWNNKLIQLTYQTTHGIVYDLNSFQKERTFVHKMSDGWGLTNDSKNLIASDGTNNIFFLNPKNYSEVRRIQVMDGGKQVNYLNELEYIDGLIWANIWQTDCVARIFPKNGKVESWLLLQGLSKKLKARSNILQKIDVLNGIAWNPHRRKLLVTGKFWPQIFEIIPRKIQGVTQSQIDEARASCIVAESEG